MQPQGRPLENQILVNFHQHWLNLIKRQKDISFLCNSLKPKGERNPIIMGRGIPRFKDFRKQGTRASGETRDDYPMIKHLYIEVELTQ